MLITNGDMASFCGISTRNSVNHILRGHRIENTLEDANLTSDAAKVNSLVVASCIGVVILCVGFIIGKLRKKGR